MNEIIEMLADEPVPENLGQICDIAKEILNIYGLNMLFIAMIYNMGKLHKEKPFSQLPGR